MQWFEENFIPCRMWCIHVTSNVMYCLSHVMKQIPSKCSSSHGGCHHLHVHRIPSYYHSAEFNKLYSLQVNPQLYDTVIQLLSKHSFVDIIVEYIQ